MTVSRVLRNDLRVSEETKALVNRVAEELGYFPGGRGKSNEVTTGYYILFQSMYANKGSFFSDLILSIQNELFNEGHSCSLGIIRNDYTQFVKLLNLMRNGNTQGIFLVGDAPLEYIEILLERFNDVVFVDNPGGPRITHPYNAVVVDNMRGSYVAVNHLIKLGRKKILLVLGSEGHYFSSQLHEGYKMALQDNGLEYDADMVLFGNYNTEGGHRAVASALTMEKQFDAVFSNDQMACGAIKAIRSAGYKIPSDIAVMGFDGLSIGENVRPALSTMQTNTVDMGRVAVKRLLELRGVENASERFTSTSIFPTLLIRESCGGNPTDLAGIE